MEKIILILLVFFFAFTSDAVERKKNVRVVYPKETKLNFDGMKIRGELRSPGEFYFQHREPQKFNSLIKTRKNFHQEMLRDAVFTR